MNRLSRTLTRSISLLNFRIWPPAEYPWAPRLRVVIHSIVLLVPNTRSLLLVKCHQRFHCASEGNHERETPLPSTYHFSKMLPRAQAKERRGSLRRQPALGSGADVCQPSPNIRMMARRLWRSDCQVPHLLFGYASRHANIHATWQGFIVDTLCRQHLSHLLHQHRTMISMAFNYDYDPNKKYPTAGAVIHGPVQRVHMEAMVLRDIVWHNGRRQR